MVIQLTKTKSITIGGGGKQGKGGRRYADVVGIDMFRKDDRGFPAVRLTGRKGQVHVAACGFVPDPGAPLPESWEEAAKNPVWSLPAAFQAPHAAFAVASPETFLVQTTLEAVKNDIIRGGHHGDEPSEAKPRKFGIRREPKKTELKNQTEKKDPVAQIDVSSLVPGAPISNGGTRFVMRQMSRSDSFVMEAGMPEFQTLWLSRLLPEGKRPTVASIQPRAAAVTACILKDPEFLKAGGSGLALYVNDDNCTVAGFKDGDLVLWRRCPTAPGGRAIRAALLRGLGVDDEMLDGIMSDNLIDPRPVLEPVIAPIVDELAVSRDYLAGRLNTAIDSAFVSGLDAGLGYWSAVFEERAKIRLTACRPFAGFEGALPEAKCAGVFVGALGAALALMTEDES